MHELKSIVKQDKITRQISKMFDFRFNGKSVFKCPTFKLPDNFQIGLIVGASGSGKSVLLNNIRAHKKNISWSKDRAIVSHFSSAQEAQERLSGVGLNSIPSWMKPYQALSTGEQFRALLARMIDNDACIDEFTSVVDRTVAKSCSYALRRFVNSRGYKNIVIASCHYDIIDWLQPDWVYDMQIGAFRPRGNLQCSVRKIAVIPCDTKNWPMFSQHHYLTKDINNSASSWIVVWDKKVIGFVSALSYPSGTVKNAWREHRTVILPDYQGLGFGVRASDAVAEIFIRCGCRYFSKTAHPRMGEYRNNSLLWRPTVKNMKDRQDYKHNRASKEAKYKHLHQNRVTYSHEYIGNGKEKVDECTN